MQLSKRPETIYGLADKILSLTVNKNFKYQLQALFDYIKINKDEILKQADKLKPAKAQKIVDILEQAL